MVRRAKLEHRSLPDYTRGEEIMNMVTHIVGGGIGLPALAICVCIAAFHNNGIGIIGSLIYGISMIALYSVSSVYHGLRNNLAKKVMQVIDHCTIYFLIAGTYTPILLCQFIPAYPRIGWSLLAFQWALAVIAAALTAIDLHNYRIFSMICYIAMGWSIILFIPQTIELMTLPGFILLFCGGIAYTIGAILYGIGTKRRWMHSVFHIFVVIGSVLQLLSIALYVL